MVQKFFRGRPHDVDNIGEGMPIAGKMMELAGKLETPQDMSEVVYLLDAASKLVETAAYGAARQIDARVVTDLFLIAARLETQSDRLRDTC